ncbi:MAG TPA: hypothetical protein VKR06_46240 [Ktedonosporobacter sp.]|nr:hypothetical protein [Ktedonosporobacter sp.]
MAYPAAGVGGAIKNGANTVANMQKWALSQKGNVAKTTAFGASGSWESNTATIRGWTATIDGWTDAGDTNGQVALYNGLNSTFTLEMDIDGTHHWSGSAILTGIDPSADAQNMNLTKLSFTGTGACTFT